MTPSDVFDMIYRLGAELSWSALKRLNSHRHSVELMYTIAASEGTSPSLGYTPRKGGNTGMVGNWVLALNIVLIVLVLVLIASQWLGGLFIKSKCNVLVGPTTTTGQEKVAAQRQPTFAWSEIVEEAKKIIGSDKYKSLSGKAQAICQQLSAMNTQLPSNQAADTVKTASIILETEYDPTLEELKYLLSTAE